MATARATTMAMIKMMAMLMERLTMMETGMAIMVMVLVMAMQQ